MTGQDVPGGASMMVMQLRIRRRPHPLDQRWRHRLADPQLPVDEADSLAFAEIEYPQLPAGLSDGPFRTDRHAAAAAVAEFLENQHFFADHRQGVEPADVRTFATEGAFCQIDQGDRRLDPLASFDYAA